MKRKEIESMIQKCMERISTAEQEIKSFKNDIIYKSKYKVGHHFTKPCHVNAHLYKDGAVVREIKYSTDAMKLIYLLNPVGTKAEYYFDEDDPYIKSHEQKAKKNGKKRAEVSNMYNFTQYQMFSNMNEAITSAEWAGLPVVMTRSTADPSFKRYFIIHKGSQLDITSSCRRMFVDQYYAFVGKMDKNFRDHISTKTIHK